MESTPRQSLRFGQSDEPFDQFTNQPLDGQTTFVNRERVPDRLERRIRFGCGFVAGSILGVLGALYLLADNLFTCALLGAGVALLFGILAVRYGDRFWYGLRHLLWFWS